jgi:hypothetical protein
LFIIPSAVDLLKASLTLNLLTTTIVAPPSNASKWQMRFNSAFKGLNKQRRNTGDKKNAQKFGRLQQPAWHIDVEQY